MPGLHLVPQRTAKVVAPRATHALRLLAVVLLASAPAPALAASVLSDGSVTPLSGTTETLFTFSVHYTSTDTPQRPAQVVWADAGGVTVTLVKVSGSANDGTWQGTATLPAGTWDATFHATTSSDPQPAPLLGPTVIVTEPPPTPTPLPTPEPTDPPTPAPEPTAEPTPPPPASTAAPTPRPPLPGPQPTPTQTPTASPTPTATGSARPTLPTPTADEDDDPSATLGPSDPAGDEAPPPPGSMLATLLIVGGTMSIAGAVVLARQWFVSHRADPH